MHISAADAPNLTTCAAIPAQSLGTVSTAGDWLVWQILDSAFPSGGLAHSGGIEPAWQQGWLRTPEDFRRFLLESARQAARSAIPFLTNAHSGAPLEDLDHHLDTMLTSHVANRASRLQGQALLSSACKIFGGEPIGSMRAAMLAGKIVAHLPIVFGALARQCAISRGQAVRIFLYMNVRGVMSAAVRLGVLGPLEAQRIFAGLGPDLEMLASQAGEFTVADAAQSAPLLELWQMSQDRLYSRLFQS